MSRLLPHHIRCTISPDSAPSIPFPLHPSNQPGAQGKCCLLLLLLLLGWSTRATSSLRSSTLVVIPAKLEIPREKSQSSLQPASAHMHAQGYAQPSTVLTPAGNSFLWKWGLRYLAEISATSAASLPSSFFLRRPRNLFSPRDLVPETPLIYGRRSFVSSILC